MESFEFNSVCEGQNYILKAIKTVEGIFDNSGLFDCDSNAIESSFLGIARKKYKQEQELFFSLVCTYYGTNQSSL